MRFNGAVKVISSVIKHIPQVYSNYHRSSTVGFSITLVILDVIGSVFSLAQQALRSVMEGNLTPFTGNLAKTTLAVESLLFDTYFIMQHVCFYPDHTDVDVLGMKRQVEDQSRTQAGEFVNDIEDGQDGRDLERLLPDSEHGVLYIVVVVC
ncbi:cystinosin isoform X1 [Gracilaria domingensis]|nr:cystinosin isoform X1 [Gracilaria domingensis]